MNTGVVAALGLRGDPVCDGCQVAGFYPHTCAGVVPLVHSAPTLCACLVYKTCGVISVDVEVAS